jgi:anti-anti-sigma factor
MRGISGAERCRVVRAYGELDLCSAAEFREDLAAGLAGADAGVPPRLVVDLTGVTFLDCSALRELCGAARRAAAGGGWVRVVYTAPRVARVMRAALLAEAFPGYASVAAAAGS